jgi:hypothetical protein
MKRLRVSVSTPVEFRTALEAFDTDAEVDTNAASPHVLIREGLGAVYMGEGSLVRGLQSCLTDIGDALSCCQMGLVFVLEEGLGSDTARQLQLAFVSHAEYKTCMVSGADEAASLCERLRKLGASSSNKKGASAPEQHSREKALVCVPGVAGKKSKTLVEQFGSISAVAVASSRNDSELIVGCKGLQQFFNEPFEK